MAGSFEGWKGRVGPAGFLVGCFTAGLSFAAPSTAPAALCALTGLVAVAASILAGIRLGWGGKAGAMAEVLLGPSSGSGTWPGAVPIAFVAATGWLAFAKLSFEGAPGFTSETAFLLVGVLGAWLVPVLVPSLTRVEA